MSDEEDSVDIEMKEQDVSDDSDDSSDEIEDEDIKRNQQFIEILQKIEENKYSYDDYVALVNIAHELLDLEKIRQSTELFSAAFPLAPEIWLRYLRAEINVSHTEAELDHLQSLFQRALKDYYSVEVALEYANLAVKSSKSAEIWGELTAYGYDHNKGHLIYAAWRNDYMIKEPESPEKYKKILKNFKEELLFPLKEIQSSYVEFRSFLDAHEEQFKNFDKSAVENELKSTKKILQKVLKYEQNLEKLDPSSHKERVECYRSYISDCGDDLEEEYIQVLHERTITACCLNESVWKDYLSYIQNRSKDWKPTSANKSFLFRQTDLDIVNRGLKNCSWSADLYIEKMRIFEKLKEPRTEVQKILETACTIEYNSPEPMVKVWMEYLSYLVRVTNFKDEKEVDILRNNFNLGWTSLGRQWGLLADPDCEILKFWGRVEYTKFEDCMEGKQLWNTVMESNENFMKSGLWIEYASLEYHGRGVEASRNIYKRALKISELNDLPTVSSSWTQMERCNGSLEHLKYCQEVCERMKRQYYRNDRSFSNKRSNFQNKDAPPRNLKRNRDDDGGGNEGSKNSASPRKIQKENPTKEDKQIFEKPAIPKPKQDSSNGNSKTESGEVEIDTSKDNVRVFFSNLEFNVTTQDLITTFPEIKIVNFEMIMNALGKSRGFGYAELGSEFDVMRAIEMDRRVLNGRPVFISKCERDKTNREKLFKYSTDVEPNKIFIRGLAFEANAVDLRRLFEEFGNIKDIRIVFQKNGKSKGIAYVEFEHEKSAQAAVLKVDQNEFMGRVLNVAISAPPPSERAPPSRSIVASLGGNRKPAVKGELKPRMSFIPTSVQRAAVTTIADPEAKITMSNSDFRKMLMK